MSNDDEKAATRLEPYPGMIGKVPLRNIPANVVGYARNAPERDKEPLPGPDVILEGSFDGDSRSAMTAECDGDTLMIRGWRQSVLDDEWYVDPETGVSLDVTAVAKLVPIAQAFLAAHTPAPALAPAPETDGPQYHWIRVRHPDGWVFTTIGRKVTTGSWLTIGTDESFKDARVTVLSGMLAPPGVAR